MVVTAVSVDEQRIKEIQKQLGGIQGRAPAAISRAMNRAVTATATSVSKEIRGKYHVKAGEVKDATTRNRSSPSSLSASVRISGRPVGLDKFKVSPKTVNPKRKSQLKISVRKDKGAGTISGAFNAHISGVKVMKRTGKKRLPVDRLFGPAIPQMAKNKEVALAAGRRGGVVFEDRLRHEIGRLIERG